MVRAGLPPPASLIFGAHSANSSQVSGPRSTGSPAFSSTSVLKYIRVVEREYGMP